VFPTQMEIHVDMVCNLYKRYTLVHAVILAVKDYRPANFT
jgi:hypothetical protein